jgi:hypothetical protein
VGIDAISGGTSNVAIDSASSDQVVAAGDESTATTETSNEAKPVPLPIFIHTVFMFIYANMGAASDALGKIVQGRLDKIADLTKLLNGLDTWNDPPGVPKMPADPGDPVYQDRIAKTDALLLDGVSIPPGDYDYAKYSYGTPPVTGYASLPIQDLRKIEPKFLVIGQLYWAPTTGSPNDKTYYRCTENGRVLQEINQPAYKTKDQPGDDFSQFSPGDLVKDKETQKYYRVANDKTGVEIEGYPLQKFIYAPNNDAIADLKNQIDNVLVEARDLSKKDALDTQDISGRITTNSTALSSIQSALTGALNVVARNIHS